MDKQLSNWIAPVLIAAIAILALCLPRYLVNTSQQTVILTITLFAILWYTWETRRMQRAVKDQAKAASDQIVEITKQTEAIGEQTKTAALQIREIVAQTNAIASQTEAITNQTRELIYQRRLSILPKFSVRFSRQQDPISRKIFDGLELVNIGNGTAVNIAVDDIQVMYEEEATAFVWFRKFLFLVPVKSSSTIGKTAWMQMFIVNENIGISPEEFVKSQSPERYRDMPAKFVQDHTKEKEIAILIRFQDIDGTKYEQSVILGLDQDNPSALKLGVPRMHHEIW